MSQEEQDINIPKNIGDIIDQEIESFFQKVIKIIECLNILEERIEKKANLRTPIQITKKDIVVSFQLIELKLKYLNEKLIFDTSVNQFIVKIFKILFLKLDEVDCDKLEEKCMLFKNICQTKVSDYENEQKEYISKICSEKADWSELIKAFSVRFNFMAYLLCIALHYSQNLQKIMDFIFDYIARFYSFEVHFKTEDLEKISRKKISDKLASVFKPGQANYFELYIENEDIIVKLASPEKTKKMMDAELYGNYDEEGDMDKNGIKDDEVHDQGQNNNDINKSSEITIKDNENKNQESINTENIKKLFEKIKLLEEDNNYLEKKVKILEAKDESKDLNLYNIEKRLFKVQSELDLIKSRNSLKIFIDIFYKGFGHKDLLPYEDRVYYASKSINKYNSNNKKVVNQIKRLLKVSIYKLKEGNLSAHNIEKKDDIIKNLLDIIDPKNECCDIINFLKGIKADKILNDSLKISEDYYYDKAYVEKEQEKIIKSFITDDFSSMFGISG